MGSKVILGIPTALRVILSPYGHDDQQMIIYTIFWACVDSAENLGANPGTIDQNCAISFAQFAQDYFLNDPLEEGEDLRVKELEDARRFDIFSDIDEVIYRRSLWPILSNYFYGTLIAYVDADESDAFDIDIDISNRKLTIQVDKDVY